MESSWSWDNGKISAISADNSPSERAYQSDLNIHDNKTYRVQFEVSDYSSGRIRVHLFGKDFRGIMTPSTGVDSNGLYTQDITLSLSNTSGFDNTVLFQPFSSLFTGKIDNVSVKEITTGDVFGFTRLEANNLQKVGIVTSLSNNTVTVDSSGILPSEQDYVLFVKNQVVNKTSLKGYYANVKFENNSKRDAEIFSVGSEITESSK